MLIDHYLPVFHYNEVHKRIAAASSEECFIAAKELDIAPSITTGILLRLRGLPPRSTSLIDFIGKMCFTYADEDPPNEFIIDASRGDLKIYWNFSFTGISVGMTQLRTETRILCLTQRARFFFLIYWFFVKPFSGHIRKELLKMIAKKAESRLLLPSAGIDNQVPKF